MYSSAIDCFESDPHICYLEISCFLQTISCLASLLSASAKVVQPQTSHSAVQYRFYNYETNKVNAGVARPLPTLAW